MNMIPILPLVQGFSGAFGVYPSPVTGNIYINDSDGFFVFSFDGLVFGIEDEASLDFTIAPNPAINKTTIQLPQELIHTVSVHSLLGAQISEISVSEGRSSYELDLSTLNAGMYFVTVNNTQTKKVIVR